MAFQDKFIVKPGKGFRLSDRDTRAKGAFNSRADGEAALAESTDRLCELQRLLYAEGKHALLIVLQGMDAAGKDGTIRKVLGAVNPQGCRVSSFKVPTSEELSHDFLWRIHRAVPPRGMIGVFNRSHYEDIVAVRVRKLAPKSVWQARYEQINEFERMLTRNGVTILKFFLHVGKAEQKVRLMARLEDPSKHWKANPADFTERRRWATYRRAYEDALQRCSTPEAPWFVIPADRKRYRNIAISRIIVETLQGLRMRYPEPEFDVKDIKID